MKFYTAHLVTKISEHCLKFPEFFVIKTITI